MSTPCSKTHLYFVIFCLTYLSGWEGVTRQVIFTLLSKPLNRDTEDSQKVHSSEQQTCFGT